MTAPNQDLILAIDNGTQSIRAILFDPQGHMIAKSQIFIEPYFSEQQGWAEQRPDYFWDKLCEACRKLWTLTDVPKSSIAGVTLTTQRGTVINLDKAGQPLRPAIVWPDKRRAVGYKPVGGLWGLLFKMIGMTETIEYVQAEAEGNWLQKNQPEIWNKTAKFLLLSGYLTYRLTGRFVDSVGSQVGYMPFDYKKLAWAGSHDWKWDALPMSRDLLPELVPPTMSLGPISPEAAQQTGIPAGLPLIAAAADKACEALGSGSLDSHIACLSFGTTATVNITYKKYTEAIPLIPPYPAAVPDAYSSEIQVTRGYWMVTWFKQEFALYERQMAAQQGIEPEQMFDDLVNSTPPGADGLVLQPYWSPGIRFPGPEARGAVIGWTDIHTRAHFYRAILEGLAYGLREGAERSQKRSGIPITELRIVGGGAQSDAALRITADVFGLPVVRVENHEASALGAAIDAAVGLKIHPSFEAAIAAMVRCTETIQPNAANHELYNQLYGSVYKPMYSHLRPFYRAIHAMRLGDSRMP